MLHRPHVAATSGIRKVAFLHKTYGETEAGAGNWPFRLATISQDCESDPPGLELLFCHFLAP